jgi:hypothetical protein
MKDYSEKIKKLPKWAQEHINNIERERDVSIKTLNKFIDGQTETSFWYDDLICTGEEKGPSFKRRFIQTHRMEVEHAGVSLSVLLRDGCIDIGWRSGNRFSNSEAAFIPTSYMQARIVSKENMGD